MIINDIIEVNRRLFYDLWNLSNVSGSPSGLSPRLILPKKRDEVIRISEQEARFLFCNLLNNLNYFYSAETPTEKLYRQKGQTPLSASSDLSIYSYENNKFNKLMNVEFKAHNPPKEHIIKDIEKLIKEDIPGNWFHLLKNIDSKTLPVLFSKISESLKTHLKDSESKRISIVFSFCVLDKKWACLKRFQYDDPIVDINKYVDDFFNLQYDVRAESVEVLFSSNWQIFQQR
jgi:hypothetical protein